MIHAQEVLKYHKNVFDGVVRMLDLTSPVYQRDPNRLVHEAVRTSLRTQWQAAEIEQLMISVLIL